MRPTERKDSKMIKCYGCGELGHKSPACRRAKPWAVRRPELVKSMLAGNEIMIEVAGNLMLATIDCGTAITVVPKELITPETLSGRTIQLSGFCKMAGAMEGELATVEMSICGKKVTREVAAVKGDNIH